MKEELSGLSYHLQWCQEILPYDAEDVNELSDFSHS